MKFYIFFIFLMAINLSGYSQNKKTYHIKRSQKAPKIDGVLDDDIWKISEDAQDFTQFRPEMGVKETDSIKTKVKITYDDNAIYFGAYLHDDPSKIMRQLTTRDNFGQSDFFGIIINPNNDAQNDTEFFVFSSGTQADAISNPSIGEDFGWNAVWESKVNMVEDGWIIEVKIPYRALRFSNENVQTWGIQFHRHFRRNRSQYTWNPIDRTKGNVGLYHGELKTLENIESPTRLSFYPFASGLVNSYNGETETDLNFGLDVKYGITENFTLDATLVPDFSQAGFDDLELNLGPFEQTYSEQRQFFTEGVDLFSKGDLFFSRRVGSSPTGDVVLNDNEEIKNYPNSVKVLNAIKLSGRTKNGLGIGIFNAVTDRTNAIIKDTISGETREQVVEPLANYNILVLDQQFNKNSSVSLINTNVTRDGHFRDANVTGLIFDISNKRNTYNAYGEAKMSNLNLEDGNSTGFSSFFRSGKSHGKFRYSFDHSFADTKYDVNDLGLLYRNNYNNFGVDLTYRIFEPTKKLNNYYIGTYVNYTRLANPGEYTGSSFGFNFNAETKTLNNFGGNLNFQVGKQFDYFEPRTDGRFFIYENRINSNLWFSSNYNKKFAFDVSLGGATFFEKNRDTNEFWFEVSPRIRFNEKLLITYSFEYNKEFNDRGYVTSVGNDIVFGERDRKTLVNSIEASYTFNSFHGVSLTFRNYWSTVNYNNNLFALEDNGRLNQNSGYKANGLENIPNINYNTWNLDFNYSWQFAPGSFLTALYRNQLFNYDNASTDTYGASLKTLFNQPIQNTFSLRIQYFIDYAGIKNAFKKKSNS
ncbi:MAG: carbohydrate binding family 9 domain-containing protein [Flavobacteriaceae bacterium]|nr:carbohydrate binding family 9 domain-containing protein [Flavobacteriaceae bacterium]